MPETRENYIQECPCKSKKQPVKKNPPVKKTYPKSCVKEGNPCVPGKDKCCPNHLGSPLICTGSYSGGYICE
jgi:hypothetical protein